MDDRLIIKQLRSQMNINGWVMILYYALMNVMVVLMILVDVIAYILQGGELTDQLLNQMILSNGWGYILASVIGLLLMLLWKKREFCFRQIWRSAKPMTWGSFLVLLCIFIGAQGFFQLFSVVLEFLLNLFGFSGMQALEVASARADTLSMFLYVCLVAPIAEEILFRGLLLRLLLPYGKSLAILGTAFLFGMYHGNPMQTPYAFAVGLILGYVTVEYSIRWAVLFHLINNLVLGDLLTRLAEILPLGMGDLMFSVIIWGSFALGGILLICFRKKIAAYLQQNAFHHLGSKAFFTSPGVLLYSGFMLVSILMSITVL